MKSGRKIITIRHVFAFLAIFKRIESMEWSLGTITGLDGFVEVTSRPTRLHHLNIEVICKAAPSVLAKIARVLKLCRTVAELELKILAPVAREDITSFSMPKLRSIFIAGISAPTEPTWHPLTALFDAATLGRILTLQSDCVLAHLQHPQMLTRLKSLETVKSYRSVHSGPSDKWMNAPLNLDRLLKSYKELRHVLVKHLNFDLMTLFNALPSRTSDERHLLTFEATLEAAMIFPAGVQALAKIVRDKQVPKMRIAYLRSPLTYTMIGVQPIASYSNTTEAKRAFEQECQRLGIDLEIIDEGF